MSHATALCTNHKRPNPDIIKFCNVTFLLGSHHAIFSSFKPEMDSINFVNAITLSAYDRRCAPET